MSKYLDPKADLTFKKVFGEHKNLVISLLNAMLPLSDDEQVVSIEYWPAEKIPDRTEAEKYSIVDVCCKDNKQREFIVEMQMSWTDSFKKRVLLNASKAYVAQTEKGMNYESLQPVYALNFVNAVFQKDVDDYYHYYHLVHDRYTDKVIDGLHLIFIELPKFHPTTFSEKRMQVLWLRFLTEINEKTKEVPAELLENEEVSKALEIVERAAFTDEEMLFYDKFWDRVSVQRTLDDAMKRWQAELSSMQTELNSKKAELGTKEAELGTKEAELGTKEAELGTKEAELGTKEAELGTKEAELGTKEAELGTKEAELGTKEAELSKREENLTSKETDLYNKEKQIELAEKKMKDNIKRLKAMGMMTTQQIADVMGLSVEEVEAL